ncbi:hypothetical protein PCH_Pc22g09330 [Penicillium rubens Wisconsin 54-1255]|uniref:Protein kinase domain-containing protein n=1 Tax=Penicillium rubens (strain ATCC 28089 / DSM 1075 / NRRL 1951 / Wisconsin 54-1255) TaxID=500485 RepID=B6HU06_PENRW|nr:hypothetical protein PCH_Pc22g09330 [Penicillium rubens Wisconsin 54-1255]
MPSLLQNQNLSNAHIDTRFPKTVTSVIVKQQKHNWEEEFRNEIAVYDKLKELQGKVIPYFFGQGYYDGFPAIVLSEIDGVTLYELARSEKDFPREVLRTHLEDIFRQFSEHGALYRDQRLDNFLLCDQGNQRYRVMVVDLEQVDFPDRLHPWERMINSDGPKFIIRDFKDIQYPRREPSPIGEGGGVGVNAFELSKPMTWSEAFRSYFRLHAATAMRGCSITFSLYLPSLINFSRSSLVAKTSVYDCIQIMWYKIPRPTVWSHLLKVCMLVSPNQVKIKTTISRYRTSNYVLNSRRYQIENSARFTLRPCKRDGPLENEAFRGKEENP